MAKSYFIVPGVLLAIFWFMYSDFVTGYEEEEAAKLVAEQQRVEQEALDKAEAERKSKEDAARRTAEREAEEAKKVAERNAKWEAVGADIAKQTNDAKAESDNLQKQINELELKLAGLRSDRDSLNDEVFAAMKEVESARIAARNAEIEVQRMANMVSERAANSVLVKAPILPPDNTNRRR